MPTKTPFSFQRIFGRSLLAAILSGALALTAAANPKWDIGDAQPSGKVVQQGNLWMITGGGADFTGTADQFYFSYSQVTGDCTMSAKIISVGGDGAHEWAKGALMVRADDSVGSAHATVAVGHNGIPVLLVRGTAKGGTRSERAPQMSFPIFLRLERKRDEFTAAYSQDGKTWVQIGKTATVPMKQTVLVGPAVTSHKNGDSCTVPFSNYLLK